MEFMTKVKFRVRWKDFSALDDTLEPWDNLKSNTKLHEYLINIGKEKLIPYDQRATYPELFSKSKLSKTKSSKRKGSVASSGLIDTFPAVRFLRKKKGHSDSERFIKMYEDLLWTTRKIQIAEKYKDEINKFLFNLITFFYTTTKVIEVI